MASACCWRLATAEPPARPGARERETDTAPWGLATAGATDHGRRGCRGGSSARRLSDHPSRH